MDNDLYLQCVRDCASLIPTSIIISTYLSIYMYAYVCVFIYTYVHIQIYISIYIHTYEYVCMCPQTNTHTYIRIYAYIHTFMYSQNCISGHLCITATWFPIPPRGQRCRLRSRRATDRRRIAGGMTSRTFHRTEPVYLRQ